MKAVLLIACVAALAVTVPGLAEVRPDRSPPSWLERKVVSLRHERDWLADDKRRLRAQVRGLSKQLAVRGESLPIMAIRLVFGEYAAQAIRVSSCETGQTFSTGATNGQYLGLFQMGSSERRTYGHGSSALAQAQAAYRYFVASGRDWGPWSCKPDGSVR